MPKLKPSIRKDQVMQAAVRMAERDGYHRMQRSDIANAAGCSTGTVSRYYGTMTQLRRAVIRYAVKNSHFEIIAQGITNRDPHVRKVPADIKREALLTLAGE